MGVCSLVQQGILIVLAQGSQVDRGSLQQQALLFLQDLRQSDNNSQKVCCKQLFALAPGKPDRLKDLQQECLLSLHSLNQGDNKILEQQCLLFLQND